jgi:SAM-dependent methyltransferase
MILFGRKTQKTEEKYIYFGSLLPSEEQYKSDLFRGLALSNPHDKDIVHDIRNPLPFQNESIRGFQSQDVFEHVERELVPKIFDEIFRCLVRGGLFRLSLPDYNSPLLRSRSAYDSEGNILGDLALGATLTGIMNGGIDVKFAEDGDAHLWFPTYDQILHLILHSELRKSLSISVHHAWLNRTQFIINYFDQSVMPVQRVPPLDMRAGGKPISIVIDFVK